MAREVIGGLINCDNLYIAKVTADTSSAYTTSATEQLAMLGELKSDPKVSRKAKYYDGQLAINYFSEDGEETLTIPGLSEKRISELVGKSYDSTKGVVFDSGKLDSVPYYALGYRFKAKGTDGVTYYKYRWFCKGQFMISSTGAKSAEADVDPQDQEVTYYPQKTEYQFTYPDPKNLALNTVDGLKVAKTDTTDPAFVSEASWFSQVQTPLTFGAPDAIALSSIVPASGASGILATANVVLTFNNKIASHSVELVDDTGESIVEASISFDATGKIMTINPTGNMATGKQAVAIFGVTDVYGQTLANSLSYFTVA